MSSESGIAGQGPEKKLWKLVDLDRSQVFVGQFVAEGLRRELSSEIVVAGSVNQQHPIVQWITNREQRVTFSTRLWANSAEENIDDRLARLEELWARLDDLERPPVCEFSVGDIPSLRTDCLVESLGGISYDEPRPDGSMRGVVLQITLIKHVEVPLEPTDPTVPESFTRVRRAKQGDTYESIAASEYGDPLLGVLLRQLNPRVGSMDVADLRRGDGIHIFPEEFLREFEFQPQYHGLQSGADHEAAEQARRDLFELRNGDAFSSIYADTSPEER